MRDAIVVGLGPAGAGTAAMLRAPTAYGLSGEALDVLAVEARGATPTRERVVLLHDGAQSALSQSDELLGLGPSASTAPDGVATIARIEATLRGVVRETGVDARYRTSVAGVEDAGYGGVLVQLSDGTTERARFLVDATGGRMAGGFRHGEAAGETVYLSGTVPPLRGRAGGPHTGEAQVATHGAGNDRSHASVLAFNDAAAGATFFVSYSSLPAKAADATFAKRLLRRHLEEAGFDPRGLRNAAFITTPHVRVPSAVHGGMLAVGDTVRRVTPRSGEGVTNALLDARAAAGAIQGSIAGTLPREHALAQFARSVDRR